MQATCYSIDGAGDARATEFDDALASRSEGQGTSWIDVEGADRGELENLLGKLGLDRDLSDQILESGHAARMIPFDGGLYFELPLEIAGSPAELKSAVFICFDRLVVTLRGRAGESSAWIDSARLSQLDLGDGSAIFLTCALLIELSVNLRRRTLDVRQELSEIADRLDHDPHAIAPDEIVNLKRKIFDLYAISEEREATLESLGDETRIFRDATAAAEKLALARENTASTARRLERLERRAIALQAGHGAAAQDKLNRRLARLTIISAIFMPLTFVAGLYGMNFEVMPELRYPFAYPLALAGMATIAAALLWWFWSRGWMD